MKLRSSALLLISSFALAYPLAAQDHWVATWTTAQPLIRNTPPAPRPAPAAQATSAAPAAPQAATPAPAGGRGGGRGGVGFRGFNNQTVRMIVHTSVGGTKLRVKLTTPFGGTPVEIGSAHVAMAGTGPEIVTGTDRALTFNGSPGTTIRAGQVILSDSVDIAVPRQGDLAVSLFFPGETGPPSAHNGMRTSYVASAPGDMAAAATLADATSAPAYYFLESVDVLAPANAALIVTYGDSITEGARSTPDTGNTWPKVLAARLSANKATANFAIANMGIGGNRVLRDNSGASALARFDRDVLSQSGVKWLMFMEGINDIGHADTEPVTSEQLIGAYKQIVERAHAHGIKVIGCTLTPYEGAGYSRPEGEAMRVALNNWMRTGGVVDAVVDFEAATRDANNPKRIRAEFDPGDHLHPNDAGYKAMGEAVDLGIFTGKKSK